MSKIKLVEPFIKLMLSQPSAVLKSLYRTVNKSKAKDIVNKKHNLIKGLPQIDILDLFPGLNETVEPVTFLYGTSMPIDFVLLKSFARQFNGNCDFFEIGTWRGESVAAVAPVCRSCTSLSLGDEDMIKYGMGGRFLEVQRFFSKSINDVTHISGNSRTFDFNGMQKKFDLIFVDGDHSYEGVKIDTSNVFTLLKDDNSIIVWHDYAGSYEIIDWEVFAGILDGTPQELRKYLYHVSNTICAIFTRKSFPTKQLNFPTIPDKYFTVTINAKKL